MLAAAIAALGITAVIAQSDPIAARKAIMKSNGQQLGVLRDMVQGKRPFDAAAAHAAFASFAEVSDKMKPLFPDSSKTGDTDSLPAIWENKADFEAKLAKFSADAKAADAKVKDLDSLKTEMAEFPKNCGGCHNPYRKKQS